MDHLSTAWKNAFSEVVGLAAKIENNGGTISGEYFSGTIRDQMLCEHTNLVATNPQYSDLYTAFKKTTLEINAYAKGHVECLDGVSGEDPYALIAGYEEYQRGRGVTVDALNTKYAQQEDSLFVMYEQSLTP